MAQIEKRFAEQGWTTRPGNAMAHRPVMNREDALFVNSHPDDSKSGDLLDKFDQPERAIAVYVRNLKRCQHKMELGGTT